MRSANNQRAVDDIKLADAQHIGYGQQRHTLEDRCLARHLNTAGGLNLYIGIVADGIGGANAGEAAGQLVIDTVLNFLQNSREIDVNVLLKKALQASHAAIRHTARVNVRLRSMGTTATIAAINDGRLYLAHIGDSRAYLVRAAKITQLTMDHTWGNEKVQQGLISPEQAQLHPRKDELARYVGQPNAQTINVDIGLRLEGVSDPSRSRLTHGSLNLEPGDVIVLCTDGIVKERRHGHGHFVEQEEIVNVVVKNEPLDAANTLISLALGRQVDDNVSVVIMEVPGKKKGAFFLPRSERSLLPTAIIGGIVGLILLAFIVFIFYTLSSPTPIYTPSHTLMPTTAIMDTTPEPDLSKGYAEVVEIDSDLAYTVGEKISVSDDARIWTTSGTAKLKLSDGSIT